MNWKERRAIRLSSIVVMLMLYTLGMGVSAVFAATHYHRAMTKRFRELDLKTIPARENGADASAIVILEEITDRQYYGYYSMWDVTHIEERNRIWKVLDPSEERTGWLEVDLADTLEIVSFKVNIYYPDGTMVKLRKADLRLENYRDSITGERYQRGLLLLPGIVADTIIDLSSAVHYDYPKHWEKMYIQGPDPIDLFRYTLTRPVFHRLAPTRYYEPVTQLCIPTYRFRAYDSNKRMYVPVHETPEGHTVVFNNVPACVGSDHSLPCGNTSSFIEYNVQELLVKNPLDTVYKPEYKQYMNIPAYLTEELKPYPLDNQQAKENVLKSAGSPAAYRISFYTWDFIIDYFYYDILESLTKSKKFREYAEQLRAAEEQSGPKGQLDRARILYNHLSQSFRCYRSPDLSHRYAPTIKVLEESLEQKTVTPLTVGLIYWGLLYHSDIYSRIGFGFTRDQFSGKFDRQYPVPLHFNAALVVLSHGREEHYLYPGNKYVRFGDPAPELENADLLVTYFRPKDLLRHATNTRRDVLHNFIEKREYPRLTTYWVQLPATAPEMHTCNTMLEISLTDPGQFKARATTRFSGHPETEMRQALGELSGPEQSVFVRNWFQQQLTDCEVISVEFSGSDSLDRPLMFEAVLETDLDQTETGLKVPLTFFSQKKLFSFLWENPFKTTIFFPYLSTMETTFTLKVGSNWHIVDTPQEVTYSTPQGRFEQHVFQSEDTLIVTRHFQVSQYLFLRESQQFIRSFFETMFAHEQSDWITVTRTRCDTE
ncbi:hypothetical protein JXQ70_11690 [bacterium]|nr:hypothetical protein [bacterium]